MGSIFRALARLALLSLLVALAACGELVTPTPTPDLAHITLMPFTSPEWGMQGLAPEGWVELMPAEFHRGIPGDDPAILQHQFTPQSTRQQLIAAFLSQQGLEETLQSVGTIQTADFSWDLYTVEIEVPRIGRAMLDIALAETSAGVYSVALQVRPEEYAVLHARVFIPAVEAMALVVVTPDTSADQAAPPLPDRTYWPTHGWRRSTPEKQGMDSHRLADMWAYIQARTIRIHSVSIVRHGYLVWDEYAQGYGKNDIHDIYSCTKSFTSALVGIAIDQGYIESLDQPLLSFFPHYNVANMDARKEALILEHLLTMTDGLNWGESGISSEPAPTGDSLQEMEQSRDWVQSTLDRQMAAQPGTRWNYNTGASHLLSAIIQETSGMTAFAFAQQHLFGPMGISQVDWLADPQGRSYGGSHLRLNPHDMAKFGYLYLNEGQWDGQQIVPAAWVKTSTTSHTATMSLGDYGYQWWVISFGSYYSAIGAHGQYIIVLPEIDMVVVFTGDLPSEDQLLPLLLLEFYVVPAVES
jgi:CubicO group peptidase (beta-lactamase class C family)